METVLSNQYQNNNTLQELCYQYMVRYHDNDDIIVCPVCGSLMHRGATCKSCDYKSNHTQVYKTFSKGQIIDNFKVYEVYADSLQEIMEKFPWEKVARYMRLTNWGWATSIDEYPKTCIPDVERLQECVKDLFNSVHMNDTSSAGTGGFTVEKVYCADNEDEVYYHVYFLMHS